MNVLVRFEGPVDVLQARGLRVGNVAGNVAVASVALADLPEVAQHEFVLFIELARPLAPDR